MSKLYNKGKQMFVTDIHEAIKQFLCTSPKVVLRFSVNDEKYRSMLVTNGNISPNATGNLLFAVNGHFVSSETITCPEQLSKTASCLTCGLCWNKNVTKPIKFLDH